MCNLYTLAPWEVANRTRATLKRAPQLESLGYDQNIGPEITSRYLEPLHSPSLSLYDSTGPRPRTSSHASTLNSPRKKHFGGWYESAATPPWYIKVDPPGYGSTYRNSVAASLQPTISTV